MPGIHSLPERAFDVSTVRHIGPLAAPASRVRCEPPESIAWWLWWNLLSLDAPTVAVLWASVFARASAIRLRYAEYAVLALSVWIVYASDRLLDAWKSTNRAALPARHLFCFRHARTLVGALILATATLMYIAARELPSRETWNGLLLAGIVAAYMASIHVRANPIARFVPKELLVGILFAIGTTLPLWSRAGSFFRVAVFSWTSFALLCALNCLSIECWERPQVPTSLVSTQRFPATGTYLYLADFAFGIAAFSFFAALRFAATTGSRQILFAVSFGTLTLLLLHCKRSAISTSALRVLADVALVVPAFLFWVIQR